MVFMTAWTRSQGGEGRWAWVQPQIRRYWQLIEEGEGGSVFFKGVAPGRSSMLQWESHIQECMDSTNGIMGLKKKKKKEHKACWIEKGDDLEELGKGWIQSKLIV